MPNTIIVKDCGGHRDEKQVAATVTPGMLVERTSADKVQAHSVAGGAVNCLIAIEDENQGNGIDDNYTSTLPDTAKLWHPQKGDQVNMLLDDASAATALVIGDKVESAGDGRVRKYAPSSASVNEQSNSIIGVALTAQSTPGGRVTIEIL